MYLKKLPETSTGTSAGSIEPLTNLGSLADKIYSFLSSSSASQISACSTPTTSIDAEVKQVRGMLAALMESNSKLLVRVSALESSILQNNNRSSRRDRSPSPGPRRRSMLREILPPDCKLCYYHYKFLGKTKNCKSLPMAFPANGR